MEPIVVVSLFWVILTCLFEGTGGSDKTVFGNVDRNDFNDRPTPNGDLCADGELMRICVPVGYMKYELPGNAQTHVSIGVDIKDIPKVNDKDFSITLNAYFIVKWHDGRLMVFNRNRTGERSGNGEFHVS